MNFTLIPFKFCVFSVSKKWRHWSQRATRSRTSSKFVRRQTKSLKSTRLARILDKFLFRKFIFRPKFAPPFHIISNKFLMSWQHQNIVFFKALPDDAKESLKTNFPRITSVIQSKSANLIFLFFAYLFNFFTDEKFQNLAKGLLKQESAAAPAAWSPHRLLSNHSMLYKTNCKHNTQ